MELTVCLGTDFIKPLKGFGKMLPTVISALESADKPFPGFLLRMGQTVCQLQKEAEKQQTAHEELIREETEEERSFSR